MGGLLKVSSYGAELLAGFVTILLGVLFTFLFRRVGNLEALIVVKLDELSGKMDSKIDTSVCREIRQQFCKEAFQIPTTKSIQELAQAVKDDRNSFWKAVNQHSHEGLEKGARVIRDKGTNS